MSEYPYIKLNSPISNVIYDNRAYNVLINNGILTFKQFMELDFKEFRKFRGAGRISVKIFIEFQIKYRNHYNELLRGNEGENEECNLNNLLDSNPNAVISMSVKDLKEFSIMVINEYKEKCIHKD